MNYKEQYILEVLTKEFIPVYGDNTPPELLKLTKMFAKKHSLEGDTEVEIQLDIIMCFLVSLLLHKEQLE